MSRHGASIVRLTGAAALTVLSVACSGGTEPRLRQDRSTQAVWGIYDLVSVNGKAVPYTEAHVAGSGSTTIHSALLGLGAAFTPEGTALYHAEWKATVSYPGETRPQLPTEVGFLRANGGGSYSLVEHRSVGGHGPLIGEATARRDGHRLTVVLTGQGLTHVYSFRP